MSEMNETSIQIDTSSTSTPRYTIIEQLFYQFTMLPSSIKSKSKKSAKESLVGKEKPTNSIHSSSFVAPERPPLGQEDSDEDDVDLDLDDDIMIQGQSVNEAANDDDDVMITDVGVSLEGQSSKGKSKQIDQVMNDSTIATIDANDKPVFQPLSKAAAQSARDAADVTRGQLRKVPIPPHRMTPLKNEWPKIYTPLVEMAGLQVRMNVKRKTVEIKVSNENICDCFWMID